MALCQKELDVLLWSVDLEVETGIRVEDKIVNLPPPQIAIF